MNTFFSSLNVAVLAFLAGLTGVMLYLYLRRLPRWRTDAHARKRVGAALARLAGRQGRVFTDVTVQLGPRSTVQLDHIVVDEAGLLLVKSIGWGLHAFGKPRDDTWKISDKDRGVTVPNPLRELEKLQAPLYAAMSARQVYRIPVGFLVVFADPHSKHELYIGAPEVISLRQLRAWMRNRLESGPLVDPKPVIEMMEAVIVREEAAAEAVPADQH